MAPFHRSQPLILGNDLLIFDAAQDICRTECAGPQHITSITNSSHGPLSAQIPWLAASFLMIQTQRTQQCPALVGHPRLVDAVITSALVTPMLLSHWLGLLQNNTSRSTKPNQQPCCGPDYEDQFLGAEALINPAHNKKVPPFRLSVKVRTGQAQPPARARRCKTSLRGFRHEYHKALSNPLGNPPRKLMLARTAEGRQKGTVRNTSLSLRGSRHGESNGKNGDEERHHLFPIVDNAGITK